MSALDDAMALTARWCAIPSVASDAAALSRQAVDVVDWLRDRLGAEILAPCGPGLYKAPPVIHARVDAGAPVTVILYNMYDVMPADPAGWQVPPFEGGTREMDGIGPAFVARGAENNKGPLAAMLVALAALQAEGRLGVNVEILIEGEEETGSGRLRRYLAAADCPVRPAAAGLFPSFCEYGGGPPRLYLGYSGIAKGRIAVQGGDWGGPRRAIHSSNAPWIANPARVLVDALSRLGEPGTGTLARIEPDAAACNLIRTLAETFDPAAELRFRDTARYAAAGDAEALLTLVMSEATLTLSSLVTDPVDADGVIPCAASARFGLRAPPGLDVLALVDECVALTFGVPGVQLTLDDAYSGVRFDAGNPGVEALKGAYAATSRPPQVWPWAIGSAPGYAFERHCGALLIGGAGRGGNAHGVDEFFAVESMDRLMASVRHWLTRMAAC